MQSGSVRNEIASGAISDVDAEIHYKWNFVVNIIEGIVYFFGLNISSFSTILPAYADKFTDSNFIISLIPAVMTLGFSLPQILSSGYTRGLKRKKRFVIIFGIPQRVSWLILAIATFFLAKGNPQLKELELIKMPLKDENIILGKLMLVKVTKDDFGLNYEYIDVPE